MAASPATRRVLTLLKAYGGSALAVAVAGLAAQAIAFFVPLPHITVLFLFAVLFSATRWGLGPSLGAAVLSVAASAYFFYPPLFDFRVADPQDLVDLLVFVVVAVLTSRLAAEVRRREAARVEAKAEQLREALINSISHDLQTPLAAILGSATALQSFADRDHPRARDELVATIREEAERLNAFIGNILDLTRIRAGQISPRFELNELSDVVEAALERAGKKLAAHRVETDVAPDLPMVRIDPFLMEHAVVQLLDNAAKYSPPGSPIRIVVAAEAGEVRLDVSDAGQGIAPEHVGRIFDTFFRGAPHDGRPAGTGLGLAICRAFVEANGGSVEVIGAGRGPGATFRIRLKAAPEPETGDSDDE